jgi:chain length determinant protein tyrosine kinase EpsG
MGEHRPPPGVGARRPGHAAHDVGDPADEGVNTEWQLPLGGDEKVIDAGLDKARPIGAIIAQARHLGPEQVEQVLAYQREHSVRFGEAAIALGYASTDDVLFALAQQFNYPYAREEQRKLSPELVALNEPFSRQAEAFRAIRSQLMMRVFGQGHAASRALAVVSPAPGDGKTYFAANLAVVLAQLGGRTLLMDADLRGPRQHEVFHLPNKSGLSAILSGRSERHAVQRVPGVPALFVLSAGTTPPNPLELVERPAFGLLMRELVTRFEHVIVDTPAYQYGADGPVIASRCGAALVIARKHSSRIDALQDLVRILSGGSTKVAGAIVNEFAG